MKIILVLLVMFGQPQPLATFTTLDECAVVARGLQHSERYACLVVAVVNREEKDT